MTPAALAELETPYLVADIGGTNARFAMASRAGEITAVETLRCADYPDIVTACRRYLEIAKPAETPVAGCVSVACPVQDDEIRLTNNPWRFSREATRRALEFNRLAVINDFTAQALAVPNLVPTDVTRIGEGTPLDDAAIAVIGPGTGLGVSGLIPHAGGWAAISGEGGHVTWAPADERERAVHAQLRERYTHISAERIVSGPGLELLYDTLREIQSGDAPDRDAASIMASASEGCCPVASAAVDVFFSALGGLAGDLALTLGAHGGVYVCGGIVARHVELLAASSFRARFLAKGRFDTYLADVPTFAVVNPISGLVGAAAALADADRTT